MRCTSYTSYWVRRTRISCLIAQTLEFLSKVARRRPSPSDTSESFSVRFVRISVSYNPSASTLEGWLPGREKAFCSWFVSLLHAQGSLMLAEVRISSRRRTLELDQVVQEKLHVCLICIPLGMHWSNFISICRPCFLHLPHQVQGVHNSREPKLCQLNRMLQWYNLLVLILLHPGHILPDITPLWLTSILPRSGDTFYCMIPAFSMSKNNEIISHCRAEESVFAQF